MKRIYVIFIIALILLVTPIIWWHTDKQKPLNVAILDKTVPNETYREHLGLNWFLNYYKYSINGQPYSLDDHYYGVTPSDTTQQVEEKAFPMDYSHYDVIYLADTYGVYEDDLSGVERLGERSSKIFGGLEKEEWQSIVNRLASPRKSMLIAEFNTFASPTSEAVRRELQDYLGVTWSGWIGRYFNELNYYKNPEIPQWVVDSYGEEWPYKGEGFLLYNEFTKQLIVLEYGVHVKTSGIKVQFTEKGKDFFNHNASNKYEYWFDIVTPRYEEDMLATYVWDLTQEGIAQLEEYQIPTQFAAIVSQEKRYSTSYYFAGDFNDISRVPSFYKFKGLSTAYKYLEKYSDRSFYWSIYIPVMKTIFERFNEKEINDENAQQLMSYNARIQDNTYEVFTDGSWKQLVIKGVNLGMGKPGAFPGEAAITEEEYYRWFQDIGKMNSNSIRVYTLHPPGFYRALARYNEENPDKPLYVFHGVWINELNLEGSLDVYEPNNLKQFQDEMKRIVDAIHGNAYVEHQPGHASGLYDVDVSKYIIGWILGIEWYPHTVVGTNEKHSSIGQYDGEYFKTINAAPFERWLAEQMDLITKYEKENYDWMRPISFTNWVTTDLLDHPSEPSEDEDLVSVDPNTIYTKDAMDEVGQFASYHVYPYYPDFFNYDKEYLNYVDHRGNKNSYAAYLNELHSAHRIPILIAEFGIPASRGMTHENVYGWNQGFMSEQAQGETLQHLFEDIMHEGLLGGLVFTWQDEWFKRTWNTMDYDNSDRRPFWSNVQTNEQQFGLLSFNSMKILVDGQINEWEGTKLYESSPSTVPDLIVDYDEAYLYLQIKGELLKTASPRILLDVIPEQGNYSVTTINDFTFSNGIDFIVELNRDRTSRVWIDEYYDMYDYLYGHKLKLTSPRMNIISKNRGQFSPIYYVLNKQLYLPMEDKFTDFSYYETGKLMQGNANPDAEDYQSLVDYAWSEDVIELRIPWMLLQAKDPSQREFIGDLYMDGTEASVKVEEIYIGALFVNDDNEVIASLPAATNNVLPALSPYSWDTWQLPKYKERLKQSYFILQKLFELY